ncbi:MAG: hypothetical protein BGO12_08030 [Verrucomicrobia bacterium 61-8]|nr:winged helix-turn-helix transcriptional regulator [Verrucomicrobiota bacterium]OJV22473.1 MAG: hypothetical protein BGO12_08030 [Verrucomicrobia bacterium 61-8]
MERAESLKHTEQDLVQVYECLCDVTRLRILNLLIHSPLCVCHIEAIIGGPQARISRHLAYLKGHQMVATKRYQNWSIYQILSLHSPVLKLQLQCLQDCTREMPVFREDEKKLRELGKDIEWIGKFMGGKPFVAPAKGSECRSPSE